MSFDTFILSLRYGLTRRINLTATLPYYSIDSDKFQGAPYLRSNSGVGDLVVMAEYRFGTAPQLTLEAGIEFPTGSVDRVDELGQRICDILALGSGTTDPVLGFGVWAPKFLLPHLDFFARGQYRFSGGVNKWGYRFGDQAALSLHASHPLKDPWRLGLRLVGLHSRVDTWFGNVVPERGSTFLYLGPTLSAGISESTVLGAFARFPVYMNLEGDQMVAPVVFGLEFSSDLTSFFRRLAGSGEDSE